MAEPGIKKKVHSEKKMAISRRLVDGSVIVLTIVLLYLLLVVSTIRGECDGASFCKGVRSSVQYSVCLCQ